MATIRATCPQCGDVELGPGDLSVRDLGDLPGWYTFSCPACDDAVLKTASPRVVALLTRAGVRLVPDAPAELDEAHDGPPITHDDLLDFHRLILDGRWEHEVQRLSAT